MASASHSRDSICLSTPTSDTMGSHMSPRRSCVAAEGTTDAPGLSPIAITGMAMRLPGGVQTPDEFWTMLLDRKDGLCEVPGTRYDTDGFYNPSSSKRQTVKTKHGYFLQEDIRQFDANFFSISPAEAERMDPQQRMLLEVVYECLESSGEAAYRGKKIGCYVGVFGEDWLDLCHKDFQNVDRSYPIGTGQFALSNRVSYEFDLRGPSMTIQTGCSSSLVGLHEACEAIHSKTCSGAIVAGTNLILSPTMTTTMSQNGVLSPSGICRTFDRDADGYGRGEAINAIYIKSLSQALQDNDPIHAVIRATGTNCDGRTPSITTPGSDSQMQLIRGTYERASIANLERTAFFECHGTATNVGDVAEVSVVAKLFKEEGVWLGAVKPNVGHSEGASGITSIIKAALALKKRVLPPNIHLVHPNPSIPWHEASLKVPVEPTAWPVDREERISVNCFGIGGSNAHAILDSVSSFGVHDRVEFPYENNNAEHLLLITASTEKALQQRIRDITIYANNHPGRLGDLAYTLALRRQHLPCRAFVVASPHMPLEEPNFQAYGPTQSAMRGVVLTFSGQGAEWPATGRELMEASESFRRDVKEMEDVLKRLDPSLKWSLSDEMAAKHATNEALPAEISQPLCTALQIGLFNFLVDAGVKITAVVGHSSGEIAAAYAAGAITSAMAIMLAFYRGQVAKTVDGSGAMAVLGLSRETVTPYLTKAETADVVVACENSPTSITISGCPEQVNQILDIIQRDYPNTFCRVLPVQVAYHSPHMHGIGSTYEQLINPHLGSAVIANAQQREALPMISSVTQSVVTMSELLTANYWRQNLELPVRFHGAVKTVLRDYQPCAMVELGPYSMLSSPLKQTFASHSASGEMVYIPVISRQSARHAKVQLMEAIGRVFANHLPIDLSCYIDPAGKTTLCDLPRYPWQHGRVYWNESRPARDWRQRSTPHHELLGSRVPESADIEPSWRNIFRLDDVPWVGDHIIENDVLFPAAAYIAMAGEAVRQLKPAASGYVIRNLTMRQALKLDDDSAIETLTNLKSLRITDTLESDEWYCFSVLSHNGTDWVKHCHGEVRADDGLSPDSCPEIPNYTRAVDTGAWYRGMQSCGLEYGPSFRGLEDINADPSLHVASATLKDYDTNERYALHPTVIDQCLQLLTVAAANGSVRNLTHKALPVSIQELRISGSHGAEMKLSVRTELLTSTMGGGDATLIDQDKIVLSMSKATLLSLGKVDEPALPVVSRITWRPDIDFLPLDDIFSSSEDQASNAALNKGLGHCGILYVLLLDSKIRNLETEIPHLRRWKQWIHSRAADVRQGHRHISPESAQWAMISDSEKLEVLEDNCLKLPKKDLGPALFAALQKTMNEIDHIFAGTQSVLEIMMEDGLWQRLQSLAMAQADWTEFLSLLGHSNPSLRVLEVGGGTGSATAHALSCLRSPDGHQPLYSSYTFTDISPAFLSSAASQFASEANMEYKILDITQNPVEQGFTAHHYDIVIADNVLHTAPQLSTVLRYINQLLKPRGQLLLHELDTELLAVPALMGILPGWWLEEADDREELPFISRERWDQELRSSGFTGVEFATDEADGPYRQSTTIISNVLSDPSRIQSVTLLTPGYMSKWSEDVGALLQKRGYDIHWMSIQDDLPPTQDVLIALLDVDDPFLYQITAHQYQELQRLFNKLNSSTVLWVTPETQVECHDPRFGLSAGFLRSMRRELSQEIFFFESDEFDSRAADALVEVLGKIGGLPPREDGGDRDFEFAFHDGVVLTGRYYCMRPSFARPPSDAATCDSPRTLKLGSTLIEGARWDAFELQEPGPNQVEVDIAYVGLNFKDVMSAMGFVGNRDQLGFEATGTVRRVGPGPCPLTPGDRVMVLARGLLRTRTVLDSTSCVKMPEGLSLKEAVTLPVVYATAIYSLLHIGALAKGQSVLIHSACGGVGLAAIQISRALGAEIFCSVGNPGKVQYLMDTFRIPRSHIFHSRDDSFVADLMSQTGGRGVDIVLNSLSGPLLHASWKCVAPFGRMIELGKRDLITNGHLPLNLFSENRAFFGVDLAQLGDANPHLHHKLIDQALELYREGKILPITPAHVFPAAKVVDAIRYMQSGSHMGKIIIEMPDCEDLKHLPGSSFAAIPKFSSEAAYLLVGGLGGIGRVVSTWMVEHGARHLVYLSRSAGDHAHDRFIRELESQGCTVQCVPGDVTSMELVQRAVRLGPRRLAGVVQLSLTLRDSVFQNMSYDDWIAVLQSKVQGTWNLHHATLGMDLDLFFMFSSVGGVRGAAGQSNYAAASTFLDAFNRYRHHLGLPSTVLDLGVVKDVGILTRDPKLTHSFWAKSPLALYEKDLASAMVEIFQGCSKPSMSLLALGVLSPQASDTIMDHYLGGDRRLAPLRRYQISAPPADVACNNIQIKLRQLVAEIRQNADLLNDEDMRTQFKHAFSSLVAKHLPEAEGCSKEEIAKISIDSLMAIELKSWIHRNIDIEMSAVEITQEGNLGRLANLILYRMSQEHSPSTQEHEA